jgi:hypothetical protein
VLLQVVERIRAVSGETVLLVVDPITDKYFRDRKIVISGQMEDIEVLEAPTVNPFISNTNGPKSMKINNSPISINDIAN